MCETIEDFVDLALANARTSRYDTDIQKENCIFVVKEKPDFDATSII